MQEARYTTQHLTSTKEIATFFSVSRRTVRDWIAKGAPIRFVGKGWQGNAGEIWEWLKNTTPQKPVN